MSLPFLLEVEELADQLKNKSQQNLLILQVCDVSEYELGHIPGAIHIDPTGLQRGIPPVVGKLPSETQLSALFSSVGLEGHRHVVACDTEGGGWAGRLIWTLHVLNHASCSFLNGGLTAWRANKLKLEKGHGELPEPSDYRAQIDETQITTKNAIFSKLEQKKFMIWDARSAAEFAGIRQTARRNGHIPNAVNYDWQRLMDKQRNLRLRDLNILRAELAQLGLDKSAEIVTHCHSHHRSGLSYVVGKLLDFNISAYPGSWGEWGNSQELPIIQSD